MTPVTSLRIVAIAALATLALSVTVACGGDSGGDASGPVRFLVFGDPPEINAYRTLIASFKKAEPDIDVQLIEASDREDLIARLSTSIAGGSPPDLFLMNYRFYGQFDWGGLPRQLVEDSVHRFATEIAPTVRSNTSTIAATQPT